MRKTLLAAAVTGALTLTTAPAMATPPSTQPRCGDVITKSVKLKRDLVCAGTALTINASDVTLDLGGRSITGPGSKSGGNTPIGIVVENAWGDSVNGEPARAVIKNGTIEGYSTDVAIYSVHHVTMSRLDARDGILVRTSTGVTLRDSRVQGRVNVSESSSPTIERNRITGSLSILAVHARVINNDISAPKGVTAIALAEAEDAVVARNTITGGSSGVSVYYASRNVDIDNNRISGGDIGVEVSPSDVRDITIRRNMIVDVAGDGVNATGDQATYPVGGTFRVDRNTIERAGGDGIDHVVTEDGSGSATMSRNTINRVVGHAIKAPTATGARNRVSRIGLFPVCIGPGCR